MADLEIVKTSPPRDFVTELIDLVNMLNETLQASEKEGFDWDISMDYGPRRVSLDLKRPIVKKNLRITE